MVLHYLKVALRNLLKYKTHSFISALCLGSGNRMLYHYMLFHAGMGQT